jgi:hypothetical protein
MVRAGRLSRPIAFLGASLITVGIVLAQSRAAYASAAVLGLWLALKRDTFPRHSRSWRTPAIALLAALLLGCLLWGLHSAAGLGGAGTGEQKSLIGSSGRWLMWTQVLDGVRQVPMTGFGWNSSYAAQAAGAERIQSHQGTRFAHDIFIDLVCWFGVPLGIALSVLIAAWWLSRMKAAADESAVFAVAVSIPVLMQSLFEFPFAFLFFLVPLGMMAGAIEATFSRARTVPTRTPALAAGTLALAIIGAWTAVEYIPAEADFRVVRFESLRMGGGVEFERPKFIMLTQLAALSNAGHAKPKPGAVTQKDLDEAREIARRYPWAPLTLQYAISLEAAGQHEEAERQLQLISNVYGPLALVAAREGFDLARDGWTSSNPRP